MPRKRIMKEQVRLSVVMSKEQADRIKHMCILMSVQEKRQIKVSEAIRMALETAYPIPKNQKELF